MERCKRSGDTGDGKLQAIRGHRRLRAEDVGDRRYRADCADHPSAHRSKQPSRKTERCVAE
ncbi:hypothetical protein E2562_022545 [Oryza meyeriana var. granulata]|uniref:Uncharacterized protein n=1 Tax=Oryza meyeriana var. granulata TaxID=110450 RepID=A0A6G1FB23_9ORYZ|nr:hypothetical protein E2562_022545 [Oryza meyeriana var. granulata]